MITLGGDAELELVDSLDPFSEVGSQTGRVLWAALLPLKLQYPVHGMGIVCTCDLPATLR
jgi:hypothetical protein